MAESESYCWEIEVMLDTKTGHTSITTKKTILIVDLTSDDSDQDEVKECLSPAAPVDLTTTDECDATCHLTSTPCQDVQDVPIIDLTDEATIIPVIDITDEDSDIIPPSNNKPEWKLIEWEPIDFDSPQSPIYHCNRGMPAVDIQNGYNGYNDYAYNGYNDYVYEHDHNYAQPPVDGPRSPSPPSSPASQDSIDVFGAIDYVQPHVHGPRSPQPSNSSSDVTDTNGNVQPHVDVPTSNSSIDEAGPSGYAPQPDFDGRRSSSPSSVNSLPVEYIDVGNPLFDIGSPSYTPASPLYDPLGPDNADDSTSSSFHDFDSGFGASFERED